MSDTIVRFSVRQRLEHYAVMLLFTILCLTGLPQKYFESGWAQTIVNALGGVSVTRWLHRASGVAFLVLTVIHVAFAVRQAFAPRGSFALVPTRQDFRDAMITLRYYLGASDERAAFDRFDYRQKFEYWGMMLGGAVIGATGVILLYPVQVAMWLPGQIVPAAKVMHSNEGLLAFLTIIVWHVYSAHLNPDVFPFDSSIFTGRISAERMRHEHPREYARIAQQDTRAPAGKHDQ